MAYLILKLFLSAGVIVAVSEVAKRSSLLGAFIASLPLTSLLAIAWLYLDTGNVEKVAALTSSILWLVLPSLLFFALFPWLLRHGVLFWWALLISCLATAAAYGLTVWLVGRGG
jgi:hypothetical protein